MWFAGYGMLYVFFALSGFLIAGSAQRLSLGNFLINRGLRIFPALVVEVLLSAFLLGVMFTDLPVREYLSNPVTYRYLTNIVGLMNFDLPGVFQGNAVAVVNYSLWTVPYEFFCYFIMSAFMVFGMLRKPALVIALAAAFSVIGLVLVLFGAAAQASDGDNTSSKRPMPFMRPIIGKAPSKNDTFGSGTSSGTPAVERALLTSTTTRWTAAKASGPGVTQ